MGPGWYLDPRIGPMRTADERDYRRAAAEIQRDYDALMARAVEMIQDLGTSIEWCRGDCYDWTREQAEALLLYGEWPTKKEQPDD